MAWFKRILVCLLEIAVAIDQLIQTVVISPFYVVFGDDPPNADETLSSRVGRYSQKGYLAARAAEVVIDGVFWLITGRMHHCRDHIEVKTQDFLADQPPV